MRCGTISQRSHGCVAATVGNRTFPSSGRWAHTSSKVPIAKNEQSPQTIFGFGDFVYSLQRSQGGAFVLLSLIDLTRHSNTYVMTFEYYKGYNQRVYQCDF